MNRYFAVHAHSALGLMLLAACGPQGGDPAAACSFDACGGDLTGRWTMESLCGTLPGEPTLPMECADAVRAATFRVTGSYEFDAGGTFRMDARVTVQARLVVTEECARDAGLRRSLTAEDCQRVQDTIAEDEAVTASLCSSSERACVCDTESTAPQTMVTGVYSVDGSTLTENGRDVSSYCVEGNRLAIRTEGPENSTVLRLRRAD